MMRVVWSHIAINIIILFAESSKTVAARDYQNTATIDNEAYEQSIAVTSSPKVHY